MESTAPTTLLLLHQLQHQLHLLHHCLSTHWHNSEWQNWQVSSINLMAHPWPLRILHRKVRTFTPTFLWKSFQNKYTSPRASIATLMILNTNLSHRYCLKCWELQNTVKGIGPSTIQELGTTSLYVYPHICALTMHIISSNYLRILARPGKWSSRYSTDEQLRSQIPDETWP